ncbi:MAG: serine/threonine-protein kinase [Rhodobacterales bacterium]|nr:serine/threonine-protein kinase [Rhodobacterales bacterium]
MAQQKAVEAPVEDLEDLVDDLQPGTKLLKGQYTITSYLNSGGFGITYLAKDSLDRNVVIKECFPSAFCRRSKTVVAARSRAHTAELRSVVQLFVREARNLSKIVHPNIVAVHQVFEDNGTAYMAIDYIDGLDLQQIIDGQGRMPTPAEIVVITEKLLHAVGFIHSNDMLHRDISPDNILISKDGEPVLIDFGAAREQASQSNRAMSALRVVKDGYSPQEFYIAGSEQGPWSDLYALGATLYHLISGEAPVNGQARLGALAEDRTDPYVALDGRFEGFPPGFLAAIDHALKTLPKQRLQSAGAWLALFSSGAASGQADVRTPQDAIEAAVHAMVKQARSDVDPQGAAGIPAAVSGFGAPAQFPQQASKSQPVGLAAAPVSSASVVPGSTRGGASVVQIAAGIAAALAIIGGGLMFLGGDNTPPTAEVAETAATAPVASSGAAETTAAANTVAETVADPAAETAEPAPQAEPVATAAAEPAPAADVAVASAAPESTPEPVPEGATNGATDATSAEATDGGAVALAAPDGVVSASQIGFAAWDIQLPFIEDNRVIANERTAIVLQVLPSVDLAEAGPWLAPGLLIYSVNGTDVQQSGSVAAAVLNVMAVDPDGKARVVVEYAGSSLERETGLLTVKANRLVSLANGVNLGIETLDGTWRTVVTGVTVPSATQLRQGDVLYRDKTTGVALDGADSIEKVMATLVEEGKSLTEFSIIRDNKLSSAAMQLATD